MNRVKEADKARWQNMRKTIRSTKVGVYKAEEMLQTAIESKSDSRLLLGISLLVAQRRANLAELLVDYRKEYGIPGDACRIAKDPAHA